MVFVMCLHDSRTYVGRNIEVVFQGTSKSASKMLHVVFSKCTVTAIATSLEDIGRAAWKNRLGGYDDAAPLPTVLSFATASALTMATKHLETDGTVLVTSTEVDELPPDGFNQLYLFVTVPNADLALARGLRCDAMELNALETEAEAKNIHFSQTSFARLCKFKDCGPLSKSLGRASEAPPGNGRHIATIEQKIAEYRADLDAFAIALATDYAEQRERLGV